MSDLIERLSEATGPDRELDGLIAKELGMWPWTLADFIRERFSDTGKYPAYTASLDAAMTLVPDGWLMCDLSETEDRRWNAGLWRDGQPDVQVENSCGLQPTAAIAICIAALKARQTAPV